MSFFLLEKKRILYYNLVGGNMNIPILVNKNNSLNESYVPNNLVFVPSLSEHLDSHHQIFVEKETYDQFVKMNQKSPMKMYIDSGYRSFAYQQKLLEYYYAKDGEKCYSYVAFPGTSEHQTGLAIDFGFIDSDTKAPVSLEVDHYKEAFDWVLKNAHFYGFILRYPKGKEKITGYKYEPWHLRYIGVKFAKEIYEKGETLEEYVERKRSNVKRI